MVDQPVRLLRGLITVWMRAQSKQLVKVAGSVQRPTRGDNIFIFATPRSGSTWLMEIILSQPGYRACDQPLDIRNPYVRRHLGVSNWVDLYQRDAQLLMLPYLQKICDGRIRGLGTLGPRHRLVSRKLVFKIQNGWQDRIDWIRDTLGGQVVLLIRHPIAVTVSRKQLPRLQAFVESDYARHFDRDVLELAGRIIQSGSFFEKGIVHWCFENSLPLRSLQSDWAFVTYEQLVTEPERVISYLAQKLDLRDVDRMMRVLSVPSRTITKSTAETQALVRGPSRRALISKWRRQVSEEEERVAFEIVRAFGIDAYELGRDMPAERYLIGLRDQGFDQEHASGEGSGGNYREQASAALL